MLLFHVSFIAPTAPTIEPYKEETVMKEESTKIIKCVAKGSPKPKVTWYRNGKMLNTTNCVKDPKSCENVVYEVYEEGDDPFGLHTIYTVQVLKIRSVLYPRDIAEFKCVASNGVSPDDEIIINLDVQGMFRKEIVLQAFLLPSFVATYSALSTSQALKTHPRKLSRSCTDGLCLGIVVFERFDVT